MGRGRKGKVNAMNGCLSPIDRPSYTDGLHPMDVIRRVCVSTGCDPGIRKLSIIGIRRLLSHIRPPGMCGMSEARTFHVTRHPPRLP